MREPTVAPSGSAQGLFERARFLAARGEVGGARDALEAALRAEPGHLGAHLLRARLLLEEDREGERALCLFDQAVLAWPRSAEARNERARCLHALGRHEAALAEAERARALLDEGDNLPQVGPVYLTLVWCLREMRRFREALLLADEGLARVPDAILADWAATLEEELAEAQKEEC
jgi:tetratricopeptide (TPR) repeat protein